MRLEDLSGIAITFVVLAVVLGIGATILNSVGTGQCTGTDSAWNETLGNCANSSGTAVAGAGNPEVNFTTYASNSTNQGLLGLNELAGWQQTLAIIVVAAVVIGVIALFYRRT